LELEVIDGLPRVLHINGTSVLTLNPPLPRGHIDPSVPGQFGIFVDNCTATFANLRLDGTDVQLTDIVH
jgi:hypothetical protein